LFYVVVGDWLSSITVRWEFIIGCFFILLVLSLKGGLISIVLGMGNWLVKVMGVETKGTLP
jgi:hypothetical protein